MVIIWWKNASICTTITNYRPIWCEMHVVTVEKWIRFIVTVPNLTKNYVLVLIETTRTSRTRAFDYADQIQPGGWFDFDLRQGSKAKCLVFHKWWTFGHLQWTSGGCLVHRHRLDIHESDDWLWWHVNEVSTQFILAIDLVLRNENSWIGLWFCDQTR